MKKVMAPGILLFFLLAGFAAGSFHGVNAQDCMKQNGACRSGCGSRPSDCTGYCQWEDCRNFIGDRPLAGGGGGDYYTDVCLSNSIVECWLSFCPGVPECPSEMVCR